MQREGTSTAQLFGFLTVQGTEDSSGYIGSAMVTDHRGYPLEFRVLTPVKPTPIQRVLFGDKGLDEYVGVELCGKQLISGLQRKPTLLLVDRRELLALAIEFSGTILHLRRPGEQIGVSATSEARLEEGRLDASASGFQPVVWEGNLGFEQKKEEVLSLLSACFELFDLMEVFTRMQAAVGLLARNDARYR